MIRDKDAEIEELKAEITRLQTYEKDIDIYRERAYMAEDKLKHALEEITCYKL